VSGVRSLAVAALLFTGCARHAQAPAERIPPAVHTGVVEVQQNRESTKYSADIVPDTQVDLAFRVNGYVQNILTIDGRNVQPGDAVAAGAALARVRTTDYAAKLTEAHSQVADAHAAVSGARAQLAEAEAARVKADQDFERARSLYESKSLTRPDLDAARAQRDAAHARVDAAGAQIESMQSKVGGAQGQQTEAESALGDTALRAPFAGVILARRIEEGALVGAGAPVFTLADIRRVKIVMGVPDVSLGQFHLGAALPVTIEAVPQGAFHGRITAISPAADPKGRVFSVEVTIANPRGVLKPGMIASVDVIAANAPATATVPLSAVVEATQDADRYAVFVVQRQDGKTVARRQKVTLGEVKGNRIAVRAGLVAGQRIVVSGGSLLVDGQTVVEIP
jgi:RND family efflux transporter MFP subunit